MSRCKDRLEREFHIRMTRRFGWSKSVPIHQIDNQSYEKSLLGQTNFDHALTPELRAQAKPEVKDEYTFDFLEFGDKHTERELERELIFRVEDFLRAMGGMFSFMGSQYRLEVAGEEFSIDLVLFHRRLRCLVAIELKIGKFIPEFVGIYSAHAVVQLDGASDLSVRMEGGRLTGRARRGQRHVDRECEQRVDPRRGHRPRAPAATGATTELPAASAVVARLLACRVIPDGDP